MNHFYRARILPLYTSSPLGKGKFHFHPGKLYSKGLWSKEKKGGGANRRVELDKLARLQIRDWNLRIVRETNSKKIKKFCDYLFFVLLKY